MSIDHQALLDNLTDGLFFTDLQGRITYWSHSAAELSGFQAEELVGRHSFDALVAIGPKGQELDAETSPLRTCLDQECPCEGEAFLQHKSGHPVPGRVKATPIRNQAGEITAVAASFSDRSYYTAVRLRLQELEQLSLIDPLTRLANRQYLNTELSARFEEMSRYCLSFGLIYIDLDHFKRFNQTFGRNAGDLALQTLARTLSAVARPFDLFGRWGDEEFVGLVRNVDDEGLDIVARRCLTLISKTYVPLEHRLESLTVSIGATLARIDEGADSLLRRAEQLMLQSKVAGRNRITRD